MYTSRLEIPKNHVRNVYGLACRLKISSVAQKCGDFLASQLTSETCLHVRSTNGVLNDQMLLNSVDNYIKEHISEVIKCKFVCEKLGKMKIEVLQNSDEEIDSVNPKHLFALIIDWIRKEFDENRLTSDQLLLKAYMLYLNSLDRSLHDCLDIENGDHNYSEVIHEYKSLSRKLSTTKRSTADVPGSTESVNGKIKEPDSNGSLSSSQTNLNSNSSSLNELIKDGNKSKKVGQPTKPKQFLFTRSDSDSSLSSLADDDESDWKVLGIETNGNKNNFNGLVMIAGKLYLLCVKLKIHSPHTTRSNSLDKPEICSTIAPMNNPRCALGSACLNGSLVCLGGYNRSECLKTVEKYDALANKWVYLEPMKVPRARFNVAVLDDKLYAICGSDGTKELTSSEVYDSETKCWRFIANCPIGRSNAGVCALNGKVYIIGGWTDGHNGIPLCSERCDVYDPVTDQWTQIADLNIGRYQVSVAALGNYIYAVGGVDQMGCLNSVERYDLEKDEWTLVEPMHVCRRGCGLCAFGDKLLAIGGHDGVWSLCSCEIYNPKEKTWSKGPSLQICRANVACTVVDNCVWCVGGFNGKQFQSTAEYLDIKNNEWTSFTHLRRDVNGNLKLRKEDTLTNLNESVNKLRLCDSEQLTNGDARKEMNSKEPLIEVEGEKMDQPNN